MEINHLKYEPLAEYSIVFGHEINDSKLKDILSQIGCQKAIAILSRFSTLHLAVCRQIPDAIKLDQYLRLIHSCHIRKLGGDWIKYNRYKAVMCTQSIFLLEKFALVYCLVEEDLKPIKFSDLMLIMDALLIVNDMLPKDDVDEYKTEYLYLMLYHNTHKNIMDQIARSFYIFSTLAKHDQETTDFLRCYEQKRGFSVEDRLAVLFNSLAYVIPSFTFKDMFSKELCVKAEGFDAKELTPVYDKIIKSIRCNHDKAKENASKILTQVWNFEPFYRTPFVKIGDLQFAFSETVITYQIWEGLYWDIRYTFRKEGEAFMSGFGKPFEHYIQNITCAAVTEVKDKTFVSFQNEFLYKYKGRNRASTDCYFRIGNVLIVVEAKAKSPHSSTLTGIARKVIDDEIKELMVNPVTQALLRLKEINSDDTNITGETAEFFRGIDKTIILSVSMEKVQPIGELLYEFDTEINEQLDGTTVVAYHNVNIAEYEVICNIIESNPEQLPTILISWFNAKRKDIRSAVILGNYLYSCGKQYTCSKYVSKLFEASLQEISLRTFGKDLNFNTDI